MLVSPHQFGAAPFAALRPYLSPLGAVFLLAGAGLLSSAAQWVGRGLQLGAHLYAGGAILALAQGFAATGAWAGFLVYAALALGRAIAPLFSTTAAYRGPAATGDLFAFVMGLSAVLAGLVILVVPSPLMPAAIRSMMVVYGAVLLGGGLGLLLTQFRPLAHRALVWAAHLVVAGAYFWYLAAISLPARSWTGIAYYGGFGALLALLPWVGPRLQRVDVTSLKTRLALALAGTAALPMIVAFALVREQEDHLAIAGSLEVQQHLADWYAWRDLEFGIILLLIAVAAVVGTIVAGRLIAPLGQLAAAADKLALGDVAAPLPESSVTEVAHLAGHFSEMRDRLVARSAERDRPERELQMYVHTVSHDLRNPLTIINGQAQILERALDKPGQQQEALRSAEAIVGSARRMNAMIQEILEAARSESGQLHLDARPLNLRGFMLDYRERMAVVEGAERVRVDAPEGLPEVLADPDRLERIVWQLADECVEVLGPGLCGSSDTYAARR